MQCNVMYCYIIQGKFIVNGMQATYLLVHHAVYHRPDDSAPGRFRLPTLRACLALVIHELRICCIVQFVTASALLIATGDGAFNVMLNSLAVTFLLDLDGE